MRFEMQASDPMGMWGAGVGTVMCGSELQQPNYSGSKTQQIQTPNWFTVCSPQISRRRKSFLVESVHFKIELGRWK